MLGTCQNLTTLNLGPLDTAEKSTDVVACDRLIEELTEHFNAGNNGLLGFAETDDLNGIVYSSAPLAVTETGAMTCPFSSTAATSQSAEPASLNVTRR